MYIISTFYRWKNWLIGGQVTYPRLNTSKLRFSRPGSLALEFLIVPENNAIESWAEGVHPLMSISLDKRGVPISLPTHS